MAKKKLRCAHMKMKIQKFLTLMSIESQCSFVKVFSNRFQVKSMFAMRKKKKMQRIQISEFLLTFRAPQDPVRAPPFGLLVSLKNCGLPLSPPPFFENL